MNQPHVPPPSGPFFGTQEMSGTTTAGRWPTTPPPAGPPSQFLGGGMPMEQLRSAGDRLRGNIERVVRGKPEIVELALTCLLAEGHLLIQDVPGTGKTSLARSIAASVNGSWHRIQFTPDLLPSDVTGVSIFDQRDQEFVFHPGAVFAHVVIADEINRASPKTQSALLEVMEERRVTVDAEPYEVPRPFLVVATQNPVDMDGTYPLPEAQLDRFLMQVTVGYPAHDDEVDILDGFVNGVQVDALQPVMDVGEVAAMVAAAAQVHVADLAKEYIVRLVAATRELPEVRLGASPRASVALLRAARARAALRGQNFVTPDDIQTLAGPVLAHRLILTPEAELQGRTAADVVAELVRTTAVPNPAAARA